MQLNKSVTASFLPPVACLKSPRPATPSCYRPSSRQGRPPEVQQGAAELKAGGGLRGRPPVRQAWVSAGSESPPPSACLPSGPSNLGSAFPRPGRAAPACFRQNTEGHAGGWEDPGSGGAGRLRPSDEMVAAVARGCVLSAFHTWAESTCTLGGTGRPSRRRSAGVPCGVSRTRCRPPSLSSWPLRGRRGGSRSPPDAPFPVRPRGHERRSPLADARGRQ